MTESVRFWTHDLFDKWGFQDGGLLDELLYENGFDRKSVHFASVLGETVARHVIPRVRNVVTFVKPLTWDWTNHNPVRLRTLDGVEIDDTDATQEVTLDPPFVDVSVATILGIARELKV